MLRGADVPFIRALTGFDSPLRYSMANKQQHSNKTQGKPAAKTAADKRVEKIEKAAEKKRLRKQRRRS